MLKVHTTTGQMLFIYKVMTFNTIIYYTNNYAMYILKSTNRCYI